MKERWLGYALLALGGLALLPSGGYAGWFWVGLVAAGFLLAYVARRNYGFLLVGCVLTGVSVGFLLEGAWGWHGAFLISLGVGFFALDRVEPRRSRWPVQVAGFLMGLGFIVGFIRSGILSSAPFAALLIAAGAYLLTREEGDKADDTWVRVDDQVDNSSRPEGKTKEPVREPRATQPRAQPRPKPQPQPRETVSPPHTPVPDVTPIKAPETPADTLTPAALGRYRRLEAWRKATAVREGLPAYIVLRNESLTQLARENPETLDELKVIKGIGPVKLERYGETLLKVLKDETDAPENP